MSLELRIALATVSAFNVFMCAIHAVASAAFSDGNARLFLATAFAAAAWTLLVVARRLRRGVEWR